MRIILNKICKIILASFLISLTSLNPLSNIDTTKRNEIVVSTNGFYYTRLGSSGELKMIRENGRHKRDICLGRFPHKYPHCVKAKLLANSN